MAFPLHRQKVPQLHVAAAEDFSERKPAGGDPPTDGRAGHVGPLSRFVEIDPSTHDVRVRQPRLGGFPESTAGPVGSPALGVGPAAR